MLTADQCRAARGLLNWTQAELSARASISAVSVRAFEKGGEMRESNRKLLRLTFEAGGVVFLDAGEQKDGGPGVRLASKENSDA
jgi:transcriptional regulator with XRE-family HTH domain